MLRRQPREKESRRISIPDDLRASLAEVNSLIKQSKRDPDVRIDYDDAIQLENLVGGRVGEPKRPYEFTYNSGGDKNARWHLALHPLEIEDISDGHMTEMTLYCCKSADCGRKSNDPEFLCDCDYVDDPYSGNIEFPAAEEALRRLGVAGISAQSTRENVVEVLGEPTFMGGGLKDSTFGYISPWIKYHREDCQLRFEFGKDGRIRLVSILEPNWEPGK